MCTPDVPSPGQQGWRWPQCPRHTRSLCAPHSCRLIHSLPWIFPTQKEPYPEIPACLEEGKSPVEPKLPVELLQLPSACALYSQYSSTFWLSGVTRMQNISHRKIFFVQGKHPVTRNTSLRHEQRVRFLQTKEPKGFLSLRAFSDADQDLGRFGLGFFFLSSYFFQKYIQADQNFLLVQLFCNFTTDLKQFFFCC